MEEIARKFFITTEPCPPEIPDCQNLRQEYLTTLDNLKRSGGCNTCAERNLKNTFTARIAATVSVV